MLVTLSAGLLFPSVNFLRDAVSKAGMEAVDVVVLNCSHVTRADFTAAQGVQSLLQDLKRQDKHVVFHSLQPSVAKILSPMEKLCMSNSDVELEQLLKGRQLKLALHTLKMDLCYHHVHVSVALIYLEATDEFL